ncbi:hypothetical protein PFICI_00185 [Pestalotiopsis fici W106-1]|uniref:Uncharacterized protein n=1 Tax=Pestalotiopsis fici (strain W106-1 / CGMCC3.15140) TaxID=1229662 RepID=W3XLM0_PESFW|nr:uncharacterized protein PFICI_00185 [Pestalotiopsis fici W106-1]ETS86357.1 hypothetical protein PFICI_00185 [Pestalotiopsis fici W106-1]
MSLLGDTINPNPLVINWIPPAPDKWNLTTEACAAATNWTGTYITAISIFESEGNHPVPISVSVEYLYTILPSEYRQNTSNTSLAAWYYNQHNENIDDPQFYNFWNDFEWNFPVKNCSKQLCQKIGWKEDPDLAGVGMLISYYIVAILTTIYYILLLAPDLYQENESANDHHAITSLLASGSHEEKKHKKGKEDQSLRTRILRAFRKTVNKFLLADLIFTVGMLGAALWRFHSASHHQEIPYSTFNMLVSFFMSCFSVLSCLVLQAVAKAKTTDPHDRHIYRWNLALPWIVIIPMMVALFALHLRDYFKTVGDPSDESIKRIVERDSEFGEWVWLNICDPWQTRKIVEVVLYIGLALLCINAVWFFVALMYRVFRLWRQERTKRKGTSNINKGGREWVAKAYRYTRRFDGAGCGVMMWAFLVLFHIYRNSSHATAGDSDGGSQAWSFGQILALAAWAPTLVDLFNRICLHPLVDKYHDEKRQREMEYGKSKLSGGDRFATDQTV